MQLHLIAGVLALVIAFVTLFVSALLFETLPGVILFVNGFATGFGICGGTRLLLDYQIGRER